MSTLLIDLDGTIVRSYPGIRTSFIEAMNHIGHPVPDEDWLHRIPGPPMEETMRSLGLPPGHNICSPQSFPTPLRWRWLA